MVTGVAESHAALLRDWAAALPPGCASLHAVAAPHELVVRIIPRKEGPSPVEFRLSDYGAFGLYFGRGFAFEEMEWSDNLVRDVVDSIRRGGFREVVWEWRGRVVRTAGELKLRSGKVLSDKGLKWPGMLGLGIEREVDYASWD